MQMAIAVTTTNIPSDDSRDDWTTPSNGERPRTRGTMILINKTRRRVRFSHSSSSADAADKTTSFFSVRNTRARETKRIWKRIHFYVRYYCLDVAKKVLRIIRVHDERLFGREVGGQNQNRICDARVLSDFGQVHAGGFKNRSHMN